MPSCSNSSNIQASYNTLSVTQGGSRLVVSIPFVSGLTTGSVIRYDTDYSGYTAAIANTASTSEVFGVIETYDSPSNKFNVVLYGSINLDSSKFADMGEGGGDGGNDIYFLSGITAGVLQNLAPTDLDHIVKPVYQTSPHGTFSGVVVNYLGYKIGGELEAFTNENFIGDTKILIGNVPFEDGFVDASISHQLPVENYPEFYEKYGTQYGYVEKITVSEVVPGSLTPALIGTQTTSSYSGSIVSVDYANKQIYLYKTPGKALATTSKQMSFNTSGSSTKLTVTSTEIHAIQTPIITITQPYNIMAKNYVATTTPQTIKVGIRVKPTGAKVTIPSTVSITNLIAQNIGIGENEDDVETILNNFESRLTTIENRLRM